MVEEEVVAATAAVAVVVVEEIFPEPALSRPLLQSARAVGSSLTANSLCHRHGPSVDTVGTLQGRGGGVGVL